MNLQVPPRKNFHDIPSSLAPAKQPKSVLKVLKGIPHEGRFTYMVQEERGQELASQTARHLLGMTDIMEHSDTTPTTAAAATAGMEFVMRRKSSVLYRTNFMDKLQNE